MTTISPSVLRTPASVDGPSHLAVLLHGVGSNAGDMAAFVPMLADRFPRLAFSVPQGFSPSPLAANGREWFSIQGVTEENRLERVQRVLPSLNALIGREAEMLGLSRDKVILIGFSQGTIMSLHLAAYGADIGAVVGWSGRLAAPVEPRKSWPKISLFHGLVDPVISIEHARSSVDWLTDAGAKPALHEIAGLGHGIDQRAFDLAVEAIRSVITEDKGASNAIA